jgi:hypothetical protein
MLMGDPSTWPDFRRGRIDVPSAYYVLESISILGYSGNLVAELRLKGKELLE